MNNGETCLSYELKKKKLIFGADVFKFSKKYNWYESVLELGNKKIQVTIDADTNSDIRESVKTYNKIKQEFEDIYERILKNCACELLALANDWREEDKDEITQQEFICRIDNDFTMEISGTAYTIYFQSDEMFAEHGVVYYGNIDHPEEFEIDVE
jgi:hypothetical protein